MKSHLNKTLLLFAFTICASSAFAQPQITSFTTSDYGGYGVSCFGGSDGSLTVNVTGGTPPYSYLWSNGETTATISNLSSSYYAVTVSDNAGLGDEDGINLTEPPQMLVELIPSIYSNDHNVSCWNCFNGSITNVVSGGVPPFSYVWEDGPTTQNRSSLGGGNYAVQVIDDNGCSIDRTSINLSEPERDDWTMQGNSNTNPSTQYIGTADNTDFVFRTNATERIRVKSNGYVGIGTNNPTALLDINGAAKMGSLTATSVQITGLTVGSDPCENILVATSTGSLSVLDPNNCSSGPLLFWSTLGNALPNNAPGRFIGTVTNHDFRIRTNNGERMIVKGDGKIGIGTSSPASLFEVKGAGSNSSTSSLNISNSGSSSLLYVRDDGKVGIGTTSPMQTLDVNGRLNVANGVIQRGGTGITGTSDLGLYSLVAGNYVRIVTDNAPIRFYTNGGTTPVGDDDDQVVSIQADGKVAIGIAPTNLPGSYKLYVADGILTEKLRVAVKTTSDWSDFVFDENYKLISLAELKTFIKENKHLPNIPSAKEVIANGIDVAEMDAKLLMKIEELTLYLIDLKKENEEIKNKLKALDAK